MKFLTTSLATLFALVSVVQATPTHQFDHFFPGWNGIIQRTLRENCSDPYAEYLTGKVNDTLGKESLVNPVIDCVLGVFPESRKAELATGALVLGLIPTILQTIGSTTVETALVGLRRPVLGFLIAAGSPTVSMMKTGDFAAGITEYVDGSDPRDIGIGSLRWSRGRVRYAILISIIEYVLVSGAVANVLHLAWQLGVNAVAIFAPTTIFGVPLWTLGATTIYVVGVLTIKLRVRMRNIDSRDGDDFNTQSRPLPAWVPTQIIPTVFHPPIRLELREERAYAMWFYILTWVISFGILVQVAFGTLVLSGLLFFSLVDCLTIVARYTLSAIVCRAVVRFELSGMMASMAPDNKYKRANEAFVQEQIVLTSWKQQPQENL
ncbi:hypothetical protein HD806DRAFT_509040 [Xylariaceae sp. AK1471]|nr:hypothetical protein HD806DRAFT_509040 [Xylariaceae sp. AK1471]